MRGRILVLGAAGRLGRAAAETFRDEGWQVTSLVRPGARDRAVSGTNVIEAHALDVPALVEAARGVDVVLHALNPPYTEWPRYALPLTYAAIDAAEKTGATLIFPGNLYNYGAGLPAVLDEDTPMRPTSRKGQIRVRMEERLREAAERGTRSIVVRAGDFYGSGRGSWFDLVVVKNVASGVLTYPGSLDIVHEWTYVPDFAAAIVQIANVRGKLAPFEVFGFPGHAVTGRQVVAAIEQALGRKLTTKQMSWWLVRTFGRVLPLGRELAEISYLWEVPNRIDGSKLKAAVGSVQATPLPKAVAAAMRDLGLR